MELEFGLVAGADVGATGGILEMKREQALRASGREILDGAQRQTVEPRLKGQAFWLLGSVGPVAECARDGFVDNFFFGDGVGLDLLGSLAEIKFALDETFQAAETGIHVGANV